MPVMKIKVDGKWVEVSAGGSGGSDYQTAVEMADEGIRTKADAIICSAEGEPIVIHDSAEDPLRGLKIFGKTTQVKTTGKNLLEVTAITKTISGVTFTVNADGSVTANGTSTDQIWFHLTEKINLPVGNYIFSGAKPYSDGCYLVDYTHDVNGNYIRAFVDSGNSVVVEVTDNTVGHGFQFYIPSGLTLNGLTVYPMLRYATIADSTYEPYTGGVAAPNPNYPQELKSVGNDGNIAVTVSGKNIFYSNSWDQSNHPASGVTFTQNADGTVTANGTASLNTAYFTNFEFKAGITYTLSGCPSGAELIAYAEGAWTGQKTDTGKGVTWTQKSDAVGMIALRLVQGTVANNMVFKPQLEIGSTATAFEPYTGQIMSVSTPNGLLGIKVHEKATVRGNYIDANGDEWLCDEIDFARGKYIRRVGIQVFDGSVDEAWHPWAISGGVKYRVQTALVASTIRKNADNYTYPNIASNMFVATCAGSPGIWAGTAGITVDVDGNIFCYTDLYNTSDVSLWTAFLAEHPMTVHYQLAAPVETDLTADELAAFKALRTKRPNTAVINDAGAQMEISYNADTEIWLENELNKRLSHNDSAAPAITNTAIGEHIMVCDSVEDNLKGLKIFGKTVQNGTPIPSVPVALENVGDGGSIAVKIGISESDTNLQTFTVSTPNGLPGVPTSSGGNYIDSSGQQWICDEIDFARGKYVHRILKVVFDGSADETWAMTATNTSGTYRIGNNAYTGIIEGAANVSNLSMGMCTHYPMVAAGTMGTWGCNTGLSVGPSGQIYIFDPAYSGSSSAGWKAYLAANPITCIFKLVMPTETDLAEADLNNFAKLHSNWPTTTVYANGVVVSIDYIADTKTYIDKTFNYQSYGLPVLSLTGDTTGMTKDNAVTMNYQYGNKSGTCTVKWQGSSSLAYDKKNFTIKFDNAFEAKTGWGAQKKYCLKANFIDPSHARNIVSARLWAKVAGNRGDGLFNTTPNRGAIDGFPIVLSINGEFWGLYTFNIPKDGWMFGLPESSTLTQAVVCAEGTALDNACSFSKPAKVDGTDFSLEYVSDENNSAWVQTSLNRLINACINSDGTDLDTTIAQYLDWQSAIDFHIFTCLIGAYDLMVKNYLLVTLDGTKWYFSVYDMDSTFGLEWTGKGFRAPNGCAPLPAPNGTYHKVMKMIATYKKDELKARYEQIKQILNTSVIHTDFYDFASEIPQTVLNEDWKKWPSIPGTSANNAAQIMDWYRNRFEYIRTKIGEL